MEHKEGKWVSSSLKNEPVLSTLIVSPPVYSHTAFLDDFFWRAFPYTQVEATRVLRARAESRAFSKDSSRVHAEISPGAICVCQTFVVCERSHREMKGEEMCWQQANNLFYYQNASPLRVFRTYGPCRDGFRSRWTLFSRDACHQQYQRRNCQRRETDECLCAWFSGH